MATVRETLVAQLREVVGPGVAVIGVEDNHDTLDRVTVIVKQRSMERLTVAPAGAMRVDYVLTIISPAVDPRVAEPELDDVVPSILDDLRALDWFVWTRATKTVDPPSNLAYDVDAYVLATPRGTDPRKE